MVKAMLAWPEAFADHHDRHALFDQQRAAGVAEIVTSDQGGAARRAIRSNVWERVWG